MEKNYMFALPWVYKISRATAVFRAAVGGWYPLWGASTGGGLSNGLKIFRAAAN